MAKGYVCLTIMDKEMMEILNKFKENGITYTSVIKKAVIWYANQHKKNRCDIKKCPFRNN